MSDLILFLLLFFLCAPAWGVRTLIEFKEDGQVLHWQVPEEETGSGFGMRMHMWLGPNGRNLVHVPDPVSPHTRPPLNNGQSGVPVDIPPDDPGPPPENPDWNCTITFINQTASEKAKYNVACQEIEQIVATTAFQTSIETHRSCNGSIGYYGVSGELGNVGASLYAHIIAGNETRPTNTAVDHEMDMKVEMYRDTASNTIGYTYADSDQIWVNRKYSDGYKPSSMASNLFHEWLHKCGYGHSSASTTCRPYSIPYSGGTIIRNYASPLDDDYGY